LAWAIELSASARKQLKKFDHAEAKQITDYLRRRVEPLDNPRDLGKALTGQLGNLWRYRFGDYRIVCELHDETLVVLVVRIGHRKDVYR
jgi:mRNA interferase RelE/StbE